MRRAIAPHRLECDEDAPVAAEADAMVGRDADGGVEVEAVELGLTGAARGYVTEGRFVVEVADAGAGAGAEGDAALGRCFTRSSRSCTTG